MFVRIVITLLIALAVAAPAAAPASAATSEEFYRGQLVGLLSVAEPSLMDMSELASNYDGSAETNQQMIAIARVWGYLDVAAQELNPPKSYRDANDVALSMFSNLKDSGEQLELALVTQDSSYLEAALLYLEAANADLDDLKQELDLG
jgi:hypothetical protein